MPAKNNLIVFDIDGTLTDSVTIHQAGFVAALQKMGITDIDQDFHSYKHHTDLHIARTIYESALQKHFDADTVTLFEEYLYAIISEAEDMQEIKGARQFVDFIENDTSFGVCYATGSMQRPAQFKLEKIGIPFKPAQLAASNHAEERAAIVQAAMDNAKAHYGVPHFDRVIAFGDGIWDLKTAQQLQLEFVGIGPKNKTLLEAAGMQVYLDDYTAFDPTLFN